MPETIKVYRQSLPALKFAGKCYGDKDRENGTFSNKWGEWFQNDMFSPLHIPDSEKEPFEGCNSYIGLCRCKKDEPFQYWIGVFVPLDFEIPEGYDSIVFDACDIAVCWIYGKEPDIYSFCCLNDLKKAGFSWQAGKDGVMWCFERYCCPRFTEPDENGNVILDMCFFIKQDN